MIKMGKEKIGIQIDLCGNFFCSREGSRHRTTISSASASVPMREAPSDINVTGRFGLEQSLRSCSVCTELGQLLFLLTKGGQDRKEKHAGFSVSEEENFLPGCHMSWAAYSAQAECLLFPLGPSPHRPATTLSHRLPEL